MNIVAKTLPLALTLLTAGCLSIDLTGVEIGGLPPKDPNAKYGYFNCDNGYRASVKYRSPDRISLHFNNGKDNFIDFADRKPSASGTLYANAANTLRWHENQNGGVLTYPASDYRTSRKLLDTVCRPR